jgi:hypothetical protein
MINAQDASDAPSAGLNSRRKTGNPLYHPVAVPAATVRDMAGDQETVTAAAAEAGHGADHQQPGRGRIRRLARQQPQPAA